MLFLILKRVYLSIITIVIFFLCCQLSSLAHHGGECIVNGPGLAGPIVTIPAFTLPKGVKYLGLGTNYTHFDSFSNTQLTKLGKQGEHIHSFRNVFVPSLFGGYGVTDNFYVTINVPYIFKFNQRISDGPPINTGSSIGIGDLTVFSGYRFLNRKDINLHASLLAGIKIPSGVIRDKDNQGYLFETDDQPGTGSWDPSVGLAISKAFEYVSISSNGLFKFSTPGTQNTTIGDSATFNLAAAHRIRSTDKLLNKIFHEHIFQKDLIWDLILEGNGQWTEKPVTKIDGLRLVDKNHGGLIIYISPGLRLIANKDWIINLSVGLPVIKELNHIQKGPDVRLILNCTRVFN